MWTRQKKVITVVLLIIVVLAGVAAIAIRVAFLRKKNNTLSTTTPSTTTPSTTTPSTNAFISTDEKTGTTTYSGYLQDSTDRKYLIFHVGEPLKKTNDKSLATFITAVTNNKNNQMSLLLRGMIKASELTPINAKTRLIQWNTTTKLITSDAEEGSPMFMLVHDPTSSHTTQCSLSIIGAKPSLYFARLLDNMVWENQSSTNTLPCTNCLKTLQIVFQ